MDSTVALWFPYFITKSVSFKSIDNYLNKEFDDTYKQKSNDNAE